MEKLNRVKLSKDEAKAIREEIKMEFKKKMVSYLLAALGLIASLAWNDAMKALFEHLFPNRADSVWHSFIYAVLVTLIVVADSIYLSHLFKEEKGV